LQSDRNYQYGLQNLFITKQNVQKRHK